MFWLIAILIASIGYNIFQHGRIKGLEKIKKEAEAEIDSTREKLKKQKDNARISGREDHAI